MPKSDINHGSEIPLAKIKSAKRSSSHLPTEPWSSRLRSRRESTIPVKSNKSPLTLTSREQGPPQNAKLSQARQQHNLSQKRPREDAQEEPSSKRVKNLSSKPRGIHAIKPLTRTNLRLLEDSMSKSDQSSSKRSRKNSAPHRRVSELSSSKRTHSAAENSTDSSGSTRAYAPNSARFEKCLEECNVEIEETEEPDQEDLETLRRVLAKERDSPEPDGQFFHQTRVQVDAKNEVSIAKRLSPMLFPPRDLPMNNQKTENLVYQDDVSWSAWGSVKPGLLPTPKPDLCIGFKKSTFTSSELEKLTSPYTNGRTFAPCLTLEFKTALQGMKVAKRQNANNMIPILEADYALLKTNEMHKLMERRVRFISTAHDTNMQIYDAWFYVFNSDGNPKWCSSYLDSVVFSNPRGNGFQTARRYNLNYCEYISDTVFQGLRRALNGEAPDTTLDHETDPPGSDVVHLHTPSDSSGGVAVANKRPKRSKKERSK